MCFLCALKSPQLKKPGHCNVSHTLSTSIIIMRKRIRASFCQSTVKIEQFDRCVSIPSRVQIVNATRLVHHQTFVSTTKLASLVPQNCLGPKDDIFETFSNICQIKAKKTRQEATIIGCVQESQLTFHSRNCKKEPLSFDYKICPLNRCYFLFRLKFVMNQNAKKTSF